MNILIDVAENPTRIALVEPHVFDRFAVIVRGDTDDRLDTILTRLGEPRDDGHVFVEPSLLRALAGALADDPDWSRQLDVMLEFARSMGWADSNGRVRAHVELEG